MKIAMVGSLSIICHLRSSKHCLVSISAGEACGMPHAPCIRCTRSLPTRSFCGDEIKWKGDGAEPSRGALIEWFKVNHPTMAREVRARVDAHYDLEDLLLF